MDKNTGKSRKNGKFWLAIIALVMLAGVISSILDDDSGFLFDGDASGSRLAILSTESRKLENLNGSEAQDGYHFYKITIEYYNSGSQPALHYQLLGHFRGKEYDDIYESDTYDRSNPFEEAALGILPSGKSGVIERYIQVKDGVSSLKFEYYDTSTSGSKKTTINL